MDQLISHTWWMTTLAAGLATATVSLPAIAVEVVERRTVGVIAFVVLGLSAWFGIHGAKLYVAYTLPVDELTEILDASGEERRAMEERKSRALRRGSRWALAQQLLFVVGSVLAGVFLITNL